MTASTCSCGKPATVLIDEVPTCSRSAAMLVNHLPAPCSDGHCGCHAARRRSACLAAGTHRLDEENQWCEACDTGDCGDCGRPVQWIEPLCDYRHVEFDAPECFLRPAGGTWVIQ